MKPEQWVPAAGITLEPNAETACREQHRNVAVTAGPGAGKTELLAQRADFLLRTNTCPYPQRILAISFKADAAANLGRTSTRTRTAGPGQPPGQPYLPRIRLPADRAVPARPVRHQRARPRLHDRQRPDPPHADHLRRTSSRSQPRSSSRTRSSWQGSAPPTATCSSTSSRTAPQTSTRSSARPSSAPEPSSPPSETLSSGSWAGPGLWTASSETFADDFRAVPSQPLPELPVPAAPAADAKPHDRRHGPRGGCPGGIPGGRRRRYPDLRTADEWRKPRRSPPGSRRCYVRHARVRDRGLVPQTARTLRPGFVPGPRRGGDPLPQRTDSRTLQLSRWPSCWSHTWRRWPGYGTPQATRASTAAGFSTARTKTSISVSVPPGTRTSSMPAPLSRAMAEAWSVIQNPT